MANAFNSKAKKFKGYTTPPKNKKTPKKPATAKGKGKGKGKNSNKKAKSPEIIESDPSDPSEEEEEMTVADTTSNATSNTMSHSSNELLIDESGNLLYCAIPFILISINNFSYTSNNHDLNVK